jgi:protein-disulfide isomerase
MLRALPLVATGVLALFVAACQNSNASSGSVKAAEVPADVASRLERLDLRLNRLETILSNRLGDKPPRPDQVYSVPLDPMDPIEGPSDAKVTIVEAFEFACPFCYRANPVMEQLMSEFPRDVRVVTKYLVVHEQAVPSGLAVCAANKQGKYTEYRRKLWEKMWTPDVKPVETEFSPQAMEVNAIELGLDVERFRNDLTGMECMQWLRNSAEILHQVGTTATPGFFVNGRPVSGLVPVEALRGLVNEELKKADAAIAGGMKQDEYYQKAVVDGGLKEPAGWFEDDNLSEYSAEAMRKADAQAEQP